MTLLESPRLVPRIEPHAVVLRTERLVLRTPCLDDATGIASLANDRRVAEMTASMPFPYAPDDAKAWIQRLPGAADECAFLITDAADGRVMGGCGIGRLGQDECHLGYWLGAADWGRGYATEAAHAVVDHAFAALGLRELQSGARVTNPASRRVLEKCGFQWAGVGLVRIRALGSSVPIDRFRLDRTIWASLRHWARAAVS